RRHPVRPDRRARAYPSKNVGRGATRRFGLAADPALFRLDELPPRRRLQPLRVRHAMAEALKLPSSTRSSRSAKRNLAKGNRTFLRGAWPRGGVHPRMAAVGANADKIVRDRRSALDDPSRGPVPQNRLDTLRLTSAVAVPPRGLKIKTPASLAVT